jgi:sugar diacid utilization regulator
MELYGCEVIVNAEKILYIHKILMDELVEGRGFRGLANQLADFLKKPAIITNLSDRVLGADKSLSVLEGNLLHHSALDPDFHHCTLFLHKEEKPAIYVKITGKNRKLSGFIFILTDPNDENSYTLAQNAAALCALEFSKHNYVLQAQREYKDAFIYDLLYSNIESVRDIMNRGEIWGWNLNRPHVVLVFELEEFQDFSSAESHLLDAMFGIIETIVKGEQENPIILKKKGQIVAILPGDQRYESIQEIKNLVKTIRKNARERSQNRTLSVGVGRAYDSPKDIFRSFQEAKVALELGRLMEISGEVPFFSDLGLARILYNHDQQELKEYYIETLGPLERFDQEQGNDLLSTLEAYIKNQFDLKATANELFLHPNTLRYRVKKIEEVLHLQLDDFDTRVNVITAFKAKYLKKV